MTADAATIAGSGFLSCYSAVMDVAQALASAVIQDVASTTWVLAADAVTKKRAGLGYSLRQPFLMHIISCFLLTL